MKIVSDHLNGVLVLQPRIFADARGSFTETYSRRMLATLGMAHDFVQDNQSLSVKAGTVRGLHLQVQPHAQGKLVRVLRGRILDVAVDLRPGSSTLHQHVAVEISASEGNQIWVPTGFAHGFCTLEPNTEVLYKVTDFYDPGTERSIRWDDPRLGIRWPVTAADATLSDKDRIAPLLAELTGKL